MVHLRPTEPKPRVGIGIYDFNNGYGHLVDATSSVVLPLSRANWHVDGARYRYGIDEVYGLVLSMFNVQQLAIEVEPTLKVEAEPTSPRM